MNEIIVKIDKDIKSQCYDHNFNTKQWIHCARFNNYRSCVKACGLGTGGHSTFEKR